MFLKLHSFDFKYFQTAPRVPGRGYGSESRVRTEEVTHFLWVKFALKNLLCVEQIDILQLWASGILWVSISVQQGRNLSSTITVQGLQLAHWLYFRLMPPPGQIQPTKKPCDQDWQHKVGVFGSLPILTKLPLNCKIQCCLIYWQSLNLYTWE